MVDINSGSISRNPDPKLTPSGSPPGQKKQATSKNRVNPKQLMDATLDGSSNDTKESKKHRWANLKLDDVAALANKEILEERKKPLPVTEEELKIEIVDNRNCKRLAKEDLGEKVGSIRQVSIRDTKLSERGDMQEESSTPPNAPVSSSDKIQPRGSKVEPDLKSSGKGKVSQVARAVSGLARKSTNIFRSKAKNKP